MALGFSTASSQTEVSGGGCGCAASSLGSSSGKSRAAQSGKKGSSSTLQLQLGIHADFRSKALGQTNIQLLVSPWGAVIQHTSQTAEFLPVVVQLLYKISAFWSQSTETIAEPCDRSKQGIVTSWNCRMFGVGRGLQKSSSLTPLQ